MKVWVAQRLDDPLRDIIHCLPQFQEDWIAMGNIDELGEGLEIGRESLTRDRIADGYISNSKSMTR